MSVRERAAGASGLLIWLAVFVVGPLAIVTGQQIAPSPAQAFHLPDVRPLLDAPVLLPDAPGPQGHIGFGTLNLLGSHHTAPGGKNADRAPGTVRTSRAVKRWNEQRLNLVGVQEMEADQAQVIEDRPRWDVVRAKVNNGYSGSGNGLAYRTTVWTVAHTWSLTVPLASGHPPEFNFLVARMVHKPTGQRFQVIVGHYPRTGGPLQTAATTAAFTTAMTAEVRSQVTRATLKGTPTLYAADTNNRGLLQFPAPGLRGYASSGVDVVASSIMPDNVRAVIDTTTRRGISDHPLVGIRFNP